MKPRVVIAASIGSILITIAIALATFGTDEAGIRAAIRATARTSALCVVLAMIRVRAREFAIVLPVSHALHYAMILALAFATSLANAGINAISIPFGIAIFALMLWNAVSPKNALLYILWIIFVIALGVNRGLAPAYILATLVLLGAGVVRFFVQPRNFSSIVANASGSSKNGM